MLIVGDRTLGQNHYAEANGFRLGGFRFAATRVTGESHRKRREICDDFWAVASVGGATSLVVSDGAGSAALGQEGAQAIAMALAQRVIQPSSIPLVLAGAIDAFRDMLVHEIERLRAQLAGAHPYRSPAAALKLYAATVIGFVAAGEQTMSFQIGDGFGACIADQKGAPVPHGFLASHVAPPENGTYANETFFFTQDNWADRLRVQSIHAAGTIVAMSDGLTSFACTKGYTDLEPAFWVPVLKYFAEKSEVATAQALADQLESPAVVGLSDDDKTVVIMQRLE